MKMLFLTNKRHATSVSFRVDGELISGCSDCSDKSITVSISNASIEKIASTLCPSGCCKERILRHFGTQYMEVDGRAFALVMVIPTGNGADLRYIPYSEVVRIMRTII
jgi:hypothetical protein